MNNNDPYRDQIDEMWPHIVDLYHTYKHLKPIIEFDITNQKIYSYPAKEYIQQLTPRTREAMQKHYQETIQNNQFILFVKDYDNEKLRSYTFGYTRVD